ncbi:MAG: 23S rRNA (pseudouridine(1915)-N(3))-methyltransferase RlmH [Paludibacteraceae bacterium]|nr:23S rRNA (pseudouridine(1915)-N(3))-methyltransferase RlmH [Paludibacteraceae bacterium]MBO7607233.1 23S rRNA (pseudouridine(1915)-N(3))-methyltransferase RlmH [Paludibacteraceae bacterium]MBP5481952.1 23S rRNA (pseudouridine(1915)-N(3))-methyltransferase RlmH [Paludibacteraceae bacterium]MBR4712494.1 23S rRNA (pseudouridine(1915)-N(3))-methyltransferase RlmH [Paludibacteraceae bacterium]MBR5374103.1 23S rRNA (pseudouridine(1915)-N(3))-methyltransferase RlmH [Paludibacteraceae bacterium]
MRITLLTVGKTNDLSFKNAISEYQKRLKFYISFDIEEIPSLKNTKNLTEDNQKQKEGELILKYLQPEDEVVLLDDKGSEFTSKQFASYIEKKSASGLKRLVFVVGGPYGFSQEVYQRANDKVSLSRMTFSHQMVRLVFTEQLYRAMTIIRGEPYHHE